MEGFLEARDTPLNDDNTNKLPVLANQAGDNCNYIFCSETSTGMVRENNQDSTYAGIFQCLTMDHRLNICIGLVADGMGGLSMGEMASSMAVTSVSSVVISKLSQFVRDNADVLPHSQFILSLLNESIQNANREIYVKAMSLNQHIGTTFTGVVLFGHAAYFGHAGDSRAYIVDTARKTIEKVTRDHSLVGRLIEMGQITEQEARSHPRRNEIYKMLGLKDEIEVDTYSSIINGNSVILLMSDGLWELVDDNQILDEVLKCSDISITSKNLIDTANKNGGNDNISLIIIKPVQ